MSDELENTKSEIEKKDISEVIEDST